MQNVSREMVYINYIFTDGKRSVYCRRAYTSPEIKHLKRFSKPERIYNCTCNLVTKSKRKRRGMGGMGMERRMVEEKEKER